MKKRIDAVLLLAVGLLCGCSGKPDTSYTIETRNSSDGAVQDVALVWGKATVTFGALAPSVARGRLGIPHPFPTSATLSWADAARHESHVAFQLTNAVPNTFDGIVFIEIRGTNQATLDPMTYELYERLMAQRKQERTPNNGNEPIR